MAYNGLQAGIMTGYLVPLLAFSTIFERFNVFLSSWDFSLKLSLILLPPVIFALLLKRRMRFNPTVFFPLLLAVLFVELLSLVTSFDRLQSLQVVTLHLLMVILFYLVVWGLENARQLERVVFAWGGGALLVALLGFWQFWRFWEGRSPALFLDNILSAKSLSATTFVQHLWGRNLLRPSATFINTNTAASFIAISV